jgi:hypothetical protein
MVSLVCNHLFTDLRSNGLLVIIIIQIVVKQTYQIDLVNLTPYSGHEVVGSGELPLHEAILCTKMGWQCDSKRFSRAQKSESL